MRVISILEDDVDMVEEDKNKTQKKKKKRMKDIILERKNLWKMLQ